MRGCQGEDRLRQHDPAPSQPGTGQQAAEQVRVERVGEPECPQHGRIAAIEDQQHAAPQHLEHGHEALGEESKGPLGEAHVRELIDEEQVVGEPDQRIKGLAMDEVGQQGQGDADPR